MPNHHYHYCQLAQAQDAFIPPNQARTFARK